MSRQCSSVKPGNQELFRARGKMRGSIHFLRDQRGSITITFGVLLTAMMLAIGGAIDIGRWLHARSRTLEAIDAAVLAGGRMLQISGDDEQAAIASANTYYRQNTSDRRGNIKDTINFKAGANGTQFEAAGGASIKTPFLSIAGIDELPLVNLSGAEFARSILAVGGNARSNVEIAMMLDITGSMQGQKIADLKAAAKDLIDIVVWADQSRYTSRVGLVPFSETVNVGEMAAAVRGEIANTGTTTTFNSTVFRRYQFTRTNGTSATYTIGDCVTERTGIAAFTDAAPTSVDTRVGRSYPSTSGVCNPANKIVPLTNDKALLKSAIDSYVASGYTAGHLGTAWAWYMLSPNWSGQWPSESEPEAYERIDDLNPDGQPKLRKIAILMTDGEYNTQYCNGVADRNTEFSTRINCASPNGSSTAQARRLCQEMKKKKITVYSIGFALGGNQSAITTLKDYCASDVTMFYLADNGRQLRDSFRDIALKISTLYLSQ
jgi:Flp pilus assembly protein TadG